MDLSGSVVSVDLVTLYRVLKVCKTASPKLHPEDSSMTPAIAILTIGSEILDGRIIDTNSSFLGRTIRSRGVSVATRVACDDDLPVIVKWFQELFKAVDLIVVTGGLGPTKDDLTRDAIAAVAGVPLIEVDEEIRKLTEWYESKGRKLTDINARQAWFPEGASRIDNPVGTASGIWFELSLEGKRKAIVALPGIPKELEPMWREDVLDRIATFFGSPDVTTERIFRVFGLPEAEVARRVEGILELKDAHIAYQVMFPEVIIVVRRSADKGEAGWEELQSVLRKALGADHIVAERYDAPLARAVSEILRSQGNTISVAESCTGGLIGELITRFPGASDVFLGGVIAYANSIKETQLGVPREALSRFGAVSSIVARSMAVGVRQRIRASIGVSITGIAGPDGGTLNKPVGTFFVGISTERETKAYRFFFASDRERIRVYAACKALDVVRRSLLDLPPPEDGVEED